mmetsp:Transcript_8208/g.10823  ORF Transcript_8208/g.10823 Transcript_8208/m.10823 type:complete len:83 (+) Transcript_8208:225-473(+)
MFDAQASYWACRMRFSIDISQPQQKGGELVFKGLWQQQTLQKALIQEWIFKISNQLLTRNMHLRQWEHPALRRALSTSLNPS